MWKYKIELQDNRMFQKIEEVRRISFPEDLKAFIREHNGETPEQYKFMADADERVFGAVLSFNMEEAEADTAATALKAVQQANLIPFGIDPFGNYVCYRMGDSEIVFWNHETGGIQETGKQLNQFLESLY